MIVITRKKLKINEKDLCRKYRTNVHKLIQAWKQGLSDSDIANATGINPATLGQIREEIELIHRRLRLALKERTF